MEKPSTYKEQVTNILNRSQKSRNDNAILYYHVLKQFYNVDLREISAFDIFARAGEKTLPSYDSITRTSRVLQEKNPELRGTEWAERKKLEQPIIDDLRTNFND
jgi:hypothetical protein